MRKRTFLLIGIIIVLLFVHFSFGRKTIINKTFVTDRFVVYVYQPAVQSLLSVKRRFLKVIDEYFFLVGVKKENQRLEDTVRLLAIQNQSLQNQLNKENDVFLTKERYHYLDYELLPVTVLGFDPFLLSKTAWINVGKNKNIKRNQVLITHAGLVGRVIEVFDASSKVMLVIDRAFFVDAVSKRTHTRCLVRGLNLMKMEAHHLPFLSHVEFFEKGRALDKGDELVTSGLSAIYPGGIPVGSIIDISYSEKNRFEESYVIPAVDFTQINQAYVLVSSQKE